MVHALNMDNIAEIFDHLKKLTLDQDGTKELALVIKNFTLDNHNDANKIEVLESRRLFLRKIMYDIDSLSGQIKNDDTILISVKHQKTLRTCFQLLTTLGMAPCMIPGVGLSPSKRCATAALIPSVNLSDEEKYDLIVECTDFLTRCYCIPVLKKIIITLHLSDYLAALIQLSFAPLKKPGVYQNFTMTQDMHEKLTTERQKYVKVYEELVENCFQPMLMKELLVLQSVTDPSPPAFVKRVIGKEMSRCLLKQFGLLSLIKCFIETYNIDAGYEWKKIDMICKIVSAKHGTGSENEYLENITAQIANILLLNNTHYLTTAVACTLSLQKKFPQSLAVKGLVAEIFQTLDNDFLTSKSQLCGTIVLSSQEVEHAVNILNACVCSVSMNWPIELLSPNIVTLFHLGMKCKNNQELKIKIRDILLKCLAACSKQELLAKTKIVLFGTKVQKTHWAVEEYEAGVVIKCIDSKETYPSNDAVLYYLDIFKTGADINLVTKIFEISLQLLVELTIRRQKGGNNDLLVLEDEPEILHNTDHQYALTLQLLTEISTQPKVMTALKDNPTPVLDFIEHFLVKNQGSENEECITVALVLLNTILSGVNKSDDLEIRYGTLIPVLRSIASDDSTLNNILCKEALALISSEKPAKAETPCEKAIADVFDNLLPVRAHGIIELTKLIDAKDPETIAKKHYIFCLFQEQLSDVDSYVYLASINGIAALGTHCAEDVLNILCTKYLQVSTEKNHLQSLEDELKIAELRMKIGDIVVKVTKRLGEMAIVHKTILLNTMLCACRDDDPLIRTSALSNLAEIALVLNYRIGSIIYEILLCIWSIIEMDKAVECRRAAVMIISSLLKGLGKDTLAQLKDDLLPLYRTLKKLYSNDNEDSVVRLHAQIALEELNDIVNQFLFPEVKMERNLLILDPSVDPFK